MKNIFLTIFISTAFFSFGQKKNNSNLNPNPKASTVIKEIFKNEENKNGSIVKKIEGGHRTGSYRGNSEFMIFVSENGAIEISVRSSIYINGRIERQYQEPGALTNFKFINSGGAYNTKTLTADWDGWSAKVNIHLTNDQQKDEVYLEIVGKTNWSHFTRIEVNEAQFQQLLNLLLIKKQTKTYFKAIGCCDKADYFVASTATSNFGIGYTFYNPIDSTCMTVVKTIPSHSVSFTMTNSQTNSLVYGYEGDQCTRCITLKPAPCPK